jgi:hypothetical protein
MNRTTSFILVRTTLILTAILIWNPGLSEDISGDRLGKRFERMLKKWENPLKGWSHVGKIKIDSVRVAEQEKVIRYFFNVPLSYIPVREENCMLIEQSLRNVMPRKARTWEVEILTNGRRLQDLIPNSMRKSTLIDTSRLPLTQKAERIPLIREPSSIVPMSGLYKNHIAIWGSHGYYYESKLDRWEWQRARLFSTVEDIFTKSITLSFLVPMLEKSGATVWLPHEREWQTREAIADNDWSTGGSHMKIPEGVLYKQVSPGFLWKDTLVAGDHPFAQGTSLIFEASAEEEREIICYPMPEGGEYGVTVSYQSYGNSSPEVQYTINTLAGKRKFLVNQKIGGGTWIYLGTFDFQGDGNTPPEQRSVTISLRGKPGEVISVDAVRFGGGMGTVARRPAESISANVKSVDDVQGPGTETAADPELFTLKTSGKSRYREAARYYLQYAGFPDTLVYSLNEGKNDYNDDYQSRGEWVNYLMGNPNGPIKNRKAEGLKVPVDLAFAFHTDAGLTPGDSTIGTLAIYSTWADSGKFPDGSSRMASRDLSDLIQTQIVGDIRALFNQQWTRRGLWDRQYSESWRPNVPVMLLELLSHQNLADMKFGLDPRFQFSVARAVYKGMLRFLSYQEGRTCVVHPLPVDNFALAFIGDSAVRLTWHPVTDPLEPTASPVRYKVYSQVNGLGFDNGIVVSDTMAVIVMKQGAGDYDFRVTAINDGGESFPSETLSAGLAENPKGTVLIVNAFDRVCAPATFDNGHTAGLEWWNDQGVSWNYNTGFTGLQYDFNRKSDWTDDDNPGWGSSYGDMEDLRIRGNTFDFTTVHGKLIRSLGYRYVSISDEVFCSDRFDASGFTAIDIILGEEKSTPSLKDTSIFDFTVYSAPFMDKLRKISQDGTNLLLSGAYTGSDFALRKDTVAARFAREVLHFNHRTSHASKGGSFYSTDYVKKWFHLKGDFNTCYHPDIYTVEAPDGIEPAGNGAVTAFRYGENNVSAGIAFRAKNKGVVLGFPIETIIDHGIRLEMMRQVFRFFEMN